MFQLSLPWWEYIVRAVVVYLFLLLGLRITGKRQISQFSSFDFILLLILSNSVQNSMNGGDNSLTGGLLLALVLIGLNWLLGIIVFKIRKVESFIQGKPEVLIHNGKIFEETMKKEKITHDEIYSVLRKNGLDKITEVKFLILETNGEMSVIKKDIG